MVERLTEKPKPVEDGFPYDVETDSLADSLGLRFPNRSILMLARWSRWWKVSRESTSGSRSSRE